MRFVTFKGLKIIFLKVERKIYSYYHEGRIFPKIPCFGAIRFCWNFRFIFLRENLFFSSVLAPIGDFLA